MTEKIPSGVLRALDETLQAMDDMPDSYKPYGWMYSSLGELRAWRAALEGSREDRLGLLTQSLQCKLRRARQRSSAQHRTISTMSHVLRDALYRAYGESAENSLESAKKVAKIIVAVVDRIDRR